MGSLALLWPSWPWLWKGLNGQGSQLSLRGRVARGPREQASASPLGASWKDPRLPLGTCLSSLPCTPSPQPLPQHLQETGVQGPACPDGLG